jgi:hypothetical protein
MLLLAASWSSFSTSFSLSPQNVHVLGSEIGKSVHDPFPSYIQCIQNIIRPVQVDYLYTHFTNDFTNQNNQNSSRYSAGIVFNF